MTDKLRLSPDLSLPIDAATRRLAILAMSGAGKSNVAVVMAEQMFRAGIPWVAIDPKGDWWGVRSSANGKGPGLPVPIFGGLHGDLPLTTTSGKDFGDLIADKRLTCVLDISEFETRQDQWRFLIDLGETLLRRNRFPLHLFLEEADEYLPQSTKEGGNLNKCLGVWQRVVKRGRFRGIGSTQITQRNATLNKDTLYQAETLIAMRVTGKADRKAIEGWVDHHSASSEIVKSLPTLADGEGWVSSPAWLKITKRVQFERRHTFDSGATPVSMKGGGAVATLADVDLDALRTKLAASVEAAKESDPAELKRKIAVLERELRAKPKAAPGVSDAEARALTDKAIATFRKEIDRTLVAASVEARKIRSLLEGAESRLGDIAVDLDKVMGMKVSASAPARQTLSVAADTTVRIPERVRPSSSIKSVTTAAPRSTSGLTPGKQRILDAMGELAQLGVLQPTRAQVGLFASYNLNGGTGGQNVADLVSEGLVSSPGAGKLALTDRGHSAASVAGAASNLAELHQRILNRLSTDGHRRIAGELIRVYPDAISRAELGQRISYNLNGGTGGQNLADLVTMGFARIPDRGLVIASEIVFPASLR